MLTIVFDLGLSGHHLEYLHYYYQGALKDMANTYVFVVPSGFEIESKHYSWDSVDHISFDYVPEADVIRCRKGNVYAQGYKISKLLAEYVRKYKANRVIATMLTQLIPFSAFFLPSYCQLTGVIYSVYFYTEHKMSRLRLFSEKFRFWLTARSGRYGHVYILNDADSADRLNKKYATTKFRYLPDPVPSVKKSDLVNLRKQLALSEKDRVFLHFGGLSKRKGTLDILSAILRADANVLADKCFIFAGKVGKDIQADFYEMLEKVKHKCRIIVYDEFCAYELLYNLCFITDAILMPYHQTNLSSGVLGYAALFRKPVIGPSEGLIGRLIIENGLGITLSSITPENILEATNKQIDSISTDYDLRNSPSVFIHTILNLQ